MSKTFSFTDLALLVGTNPLPNYVVAKYYLAVNKKMLERIWLIHSEETGQYADDIEAVLKKDLGQAPVMIVKCTLPDIGVAVEIKRAIQNHMGADKYPIKKVHLNYTGGTKAMAVHVYQALQEQWQGAFSASYLDARDYRIKQDDDSTFDSGDLRKIISLSWEDLFRLHNMEEIRARNIEYVDTLDYSTADKIVANIAKLADNNKIMEIKEWAKISNNLFNKPQEQLEKITDYIQNTLHEYTPNNNPELFSFLASFPPKDRFIDDKDNWIINNFPISGKANNTSSLKKFLGGTWLEAYVEWVLNKKIKEKDIRNSETSHNHELKTREDKGTRKAEIDVLVNNGYQICVISCGTALDKKQKISHEIKNKGFEVILRSRQMGGDEARAVLVTLFDKESAENLENDLKASTGASKDNFIVLGIEDLPIEKMWEKLKKHIYK